MGYDDEENNFEMTNTDNNNHQEEIESKGGGVRKIVLIIISTLLFILWAYSAYSQINDAELAILWALFYACNAFVAIAFVVTKAFCTITQGLNVVKPLSIQLVLLIIWGIGLTIASSIDVSNAPKGDEYAGDDSEFANYREEQVLKLSGALLCVASATYHLAVLKYCM
jgi:hypothetical protein